ncbi:MAG: hypothetical protein SFU84_01200 [Gemmatimonadales bacterium]|nr:hypothetical protein [Gemmatimonadales bacterium]
MAPSSPTCVSCNRPFLGNGELASLPEGRRIAFDPGQRRVWRICTKCGEWNLLGAEAAGAALGELEARVPTRGSALLITHVGPRLELLRVDNFADVRVGELAMAERRDTLSSGSGLIGAIMGVGIVAVIPICIWFASRRAELVVYLTIMFSIGMFGREWYRRRQGLRLSRNRLELGAIFAVAGLISAIVGGVDLLVIGWAALTGFATFATTIVLPITTKLPSGRAVRVPAEHWESIGIRWDVERGEISLQPRDGIWLGPSDSRAFLRHILEESLIAALTDEALAKGHLLATTHSIEGILGALDAWRQDRDDTLRLTDIPVMYLIALELAFERREGGSPKAQLAHEKLLEAARVADEAELLDKGSA